MNIMKPDIKLKLLETASCPVPKCSKCKAVNMQGIRYIDTESLCIIYECDKCCIKEIKAWRQAKKLRDEKRAAREASGWKGKGNTKKPEKYRFMKAREWALFIQYINKEIYDLLWQLIFNSGARLSEILSLKWVDIDLVNRTFAFKSLKRIDKVEREYLLPGHLLPFLESIKAEEGFVFVINDKRITKRMAQWNFKETAKKAGLNPYLSPHSLRHLFGIRVWKNTKDIVAVSKMMGHTSIKTSEIYMHEDGEEILSNLLEAEKENYE